MQLDMFSSQSNFVGLVDTADVSLSPEWCPGGCRPAHIGPVLELREIGIAYMEDGMCGCGVQMHHYHCLVCGGLEQVG